GSETKVFSRLSRKAALEAGVMKDGEEVAHAPRQDEEVPHGGVVGHAVEGVEEDAAGVGEVARYHEAESPGFAGGDGGLDGDEDEPAHGQVGKGGEHLETTGVKRLEQDAHGGESPDQPKEGPAPGASQVQ